MSITPLYPSRPTETAPAVETPLNEVSPLLDQNQHGDHPVLLTEKAIDPAIETPVDPVAGQSWHQAAEMLARGALRAARAIRAASKWSQNLEIKVC